MKKIATWAAFTAFIIFLIDWGVIGLKLLDGNYDITSGAYIGAACLGVMLVCAVCRLFSSKCPHCGKLTQSNGNYCPYCGKEIN